MCETLCMCDGRMVNSHASIHEGLFQTVCAPDRTLRRDAGRLESAASAVQLTESSEKENANLEESV